MSATMNRRDIDAEDLGRARLVARADVHDMLDVCVFELAQGDELVRRTREHEAIGADRAQDDVDIGRIEQRALP